MVSNSQEFRRFKKDLKSKLPDRGNYRDLGDSFVEKQVRLLLEIPDPKDQVVRNRFFENDHRLVLCL